MPTIHYPAILEIGEDPASGFCVFFPDLPGCTSAGETQQQAVDNATSILQVFVDMTLERGGNLPDPSSLDDVDVDTEVTEKARVLVPAKLPAGKAIRLSVTMDEELVKAIDATADNRSAFLASAAREKLRGMGRG